MKRNAYSVREFIPLIFCLASLPDRVPCHQIFFRAITDGSTGALILDVAVIDSAEKQTATSEVSVFYVISWDGFQNPLKC